MNSDYRKPLKNSHFEVECHGQIEFEKLRNNIDCLRETSSRYARVARELQSVQAEISITKQELRALQAQVQNVTEKLVLMTFPTTPQDR